MAADGVEIDSTGLGLDEVIDTIVRLVRKARDRAGVPSPRHTSR
jgi:cytidylate kinase